MKNLKEFRLLTFIVVIMTTIMQISIVIAYKPVQFGSLLLPGGVIGFPLVFTLSDIIAEVYGYKYARRAVWQALASSVFFTLVIILIVNLPSPSYWHFQKDYQVVFANMYRVLMAVILGISASSFVNIYLFSKLKIQLKGRHFWIRCFIASAIGETVVTLIADITAFWGTMPLKAFIHMVLSVYLLKILYSLLASFPAAIVTFFLKKVENTDVYDFHTDFNPFKLEV